jgi:hypothetical protein
VVEEREVLVLVLDQDPVSEGARLLQDVLLRRAEERPQMMRMRVMMRMRMRMRVGRPGRGEWRAWRQQRGSGAGSAEFAGLRAQALTQARDEW